MQLQTSRKERFSLLRYSYLFLLILIPLLTSCESSRTIVNQLEEKEANEILVLLSTKNINAEKVKSAEAQGGGGGQKMTLWDISVPEDQTTQAMSILNNAGLPRRKSQNLLKIFSNTGLVPTDMAEKIRYQAGLASQIASTIRNIDGVLDADVLISFPEQDPLNPTAPKKDITASVYVKHSGVLDDPNTHLGSKIKNLVTSSVSGLKFENVTLVPDRARFTDIPAGGFAQSDDDLQYIRIWTVTVAKDSAFTFRVFFFSFSLIILALILLFVWFAWKMFPLLQSHGGIKELFHLKPIHTDRTATDSEASDVKKGKKEEKSKGRDLDEFGDEFDESIADESADFGGDIDVSDDERF
ncbi:MAG: type III secretion inner membrane ring lipoprotein SctJ [Chlamydiota bacterium]|nr:type III secretion inner membrane ring lipoprotein SctJ [Chlamydiota bacterium]